MAKNPEGTSGGDRVGYKSPPKHTRWEKGQSGNPHGSSRKTRVKKLMAEAGFNDIIYEEATAPVTVTLSGGAKVEMPWFRAALKKYNQLALADDRGRGRLRDSLTLALNAEANRQPGAGFFSDERMLESLPDELLVGLENHFAALEKKSQQKG